MAVSNDFTDAFKRYLYEFFNYKESVVINTMSISNDISYSETDNVIYCPICYGNELLQIIEGEGLFVKQICKCTYLISASQ